MHMKKRFAQTAAVLLIGVLLYAFGIWEGCRQAQFTGEKEKRCYPTEREARERAEEEPVLCAPVSSYASEKETRIAEGEERGTIDLSGQDILQGIDRIYQVFSDGEDGNILLIQYAGYEAASPNPALGIMLGETDTGYLAGSVSIGADSEMGKR